MKKLMYLGPIILVLGIVLVFLCVEQKEELKLTETKSAPDTPLSTEVLTTALPMTAAPTTAPPTTPVATTPQPTTPALTTPVPMEGEVSGELDLDEANIIGVEFRKDSSGRYTFSVTIRHNDTGWNHYADWWRIKTLDGTEIARRVLAHPHENEQPFTRSLSGITVPEGINRVVVEAHDSVHEYGGQTMIVDLTANG